MIIPTLYDFKDQLQSASIKRGTQIFSGLRVLLDRDTQQISFVPDTNCIPQIGDIIVVRNKEYKVIDVEEECGFGDELYCYTAHYESPNSAHPTFGQQIINIHTANNSIIGSQQHANIFSENALSTIRDKIEKISDNEDRKQLSKLVERLEVVIEDNQPVSKGFFAKFSDVLAKYSDIAIAIGTAIIKWLSGN